MFYDHALGDLEADPGQIAAVFSWLALPGVLAFAVGFLLKHFSFRSMIGFSTALVGAGLVWSGLAPSLTAMSPGLLALGLGPILFYPVINGLKLLESPKPEAATGLGRLRSFGPLASLLAAGLVILVLAGVGFRVAMLMLGVAIIAIGIFATRELSADQLAGGRSELQPRLELLPYYGLHFFAGIRSGVFRAFVIVFLIREHGIEISTTATLVLSASLASLFGYRLIGYLGDRIGKITALTWLFSIIALNYLGFILFRESAVMLSILFIIDSFLFGTSVITDSSLRASANDCDVAGHIAIELMRSPLASRCDNPGAWLLSSASSPPLTSTRLAISGCSKLASPGRRNESIRSATGLSPASSTSSRACSAIIARGYLKNSGAGALRCRDLPMGTNTSLTPLLSPLSMRFSRYSTSFVKG